MLSCVNTWSSTCTKWFGKEIISKRLMERVILLLVEGNPPIIMGISWSPIWLRSINFVSDSFTVICTSCQGRERGWKEVLGTMELSLTNSALVSFISWHIQLTSFYVFVPSSPAQYYKHFFTRQFFLSDSADFVVVEWMKINWEDGNVNVARIVKCELVELDKHPSFNELHEGRIVVRAKQAQAFKECQDFSYGTVVSVKRFSLGQVSTHLPCQYHHYLDAIAFAC